MMEQKIIPKSKTEKLREGIAVFVYISQTGGLACPVYWLKLFLECFDLTAASKNDVSDRLIGKHGRWSSNSSKDKYIKDSKNQNLWVCQ